MCSFYFSDKYLGNFNEVNKFLKLRGPDSTNIINIDKYTLIHNLLSLTGKFTEQPLCKNNVYLLFNGEIYNFKKLDEKAECDSEVLLPLYEKYGIEFTNMLDGEYAILILDLNNKKIIFSSDVFGTKPLFYSIENNNICVSTYPYSIKVSNFSNVKKAMPNTTYEFDIDSKKLNMKEIKQFNLDQTTDNIDGWYAKFEEAIKKRVNFSLNQKFFISLSSGYDSGIISCALNNLDYVDYKSYSISASENLSIIDSRLNLIKNKKFINLKKSEYEFSKTLFNNRCEDFGNNLGYISNDKATYGLTHICMLAIKEGRKIHISGQGADEIISDYGIGGKKIYSHSTFGGKFPLNLHSVFPWKNFFYGTQELYLSKEEYVTGAFGIESRYPFLDVDLVQEFLNLSIDIKNKEYKYVIKEYLSKNKYPFDKNVKIGFQADRNLV